MLQAPTDNLYKFMAIFGLVLAGFSIYIPLQRLEAYDRSNLERGQVAEAVLDRLVFLDGDARKGLKCAITRTQEGEGNSLGNSDVCPKVDTAEIESDNVQKQGYRTYMT